MANIDIQTLIDQYPELLQKELKNSWEALVLKGEEEHIDLSQWPVSFIESIFKIWARSDFVREQCIRCPELLDAWSHKESDLYREKKFSGFHAELRAQSADVSDEASLMVCLRKFRRREMVRIVWRDLLNLSVMEETVESVTALADVCLQVALDNLYQYLEQKYGTPFSRACEGEVARQQYMFVLAMGKHGARELNVSSDIDLIFAYPERGETNHATKPIDNQLFFTRLGQRLIHVLDHVNADGFVFRVDMRLRPYGDSGALAMNFASLEDYYFNQGREWERFAMIKARIVNPYVDTDAATALETLIRPFVYRKYTDFTSIQALRDMKRMITAEVFRKGGEQNIKLGSGGIREIEFIAQACQLIYGGRDKTLQRTELKAVYGLLAEADYLPQEWVKELLEAYRFLRDLEHAIQGLNDQQTQLIPGDEIARERIAWSLGYASWPEAEKVMSSHREKVSEHFQNFLSENDSEACEGVDNLDVWLSFWQVSPDQVSLESLLMQKGFENVEQSYERIAQLKESRMFASMSKEARQHFDRFFPMLMETLAQCENPSATLLRMLNLVQAILGRSVYFVLLYENPKALAQLCKLCSESPWIGEHIAKCPVILDELLDASTLFNPPDRAQLKDELRQQMLRIPEDDLEAQMNSLRAFKQAHMLRVAASELGGQLPLMKVSDYLTWLAEVLVEEAMHIAWRNLVAKHGVPDGLDELSGSDVAGLSSTGFAIVGYGKLGGIELGYSSDLDMVFIYDANDHGMTNGERSINNQVFYARLGQRIIHILSAQTVQGMLYEADMRLRPSGNSGMLVSSIAAFKKYQLNDAWTWEHQALVRARAFAGDPKVVALFDEIRHDILSQERELVALKKEVLDMRSKMKVLNKDGNIKHANGGLVDIEFITQLGVLAFAFKDAELLEWSDNIRQLEVLEKGKYLSDTELTPLLDAYRDLRSALHRNSLAEHTVRQNISDFEQHAQNVQEIWLNIFEKLPEEQ